MDFTFWFFSNLSNSLAAKTLQCVRQLVDLKGTWKIHDTMIRGEKNMEDFEGRNLCPSTKRWNSNCSDFTFNESLSLAYLILPTGISVSHHQSWTTTLTEGKCNLITVKNCFILLISLKE